ASADDDDRGPPDTGAPGAGACASSLREPQAAHSSVAESTPTINRRMTFIMLRGVRPAGSAGATRLGLELLLERRNRLLEHLSVAWRRGGGEIGARACERQLNRAACSARFALLRRESG